MTAPPNPKTEFARDGCTARLRKEDIETAPERPTSPPPCLDGIPEELQPLRQWITWRYGRFANKWTKVPNWPTRKKNADTTKPETWGKLDDAHVFYLAHRDDKGEWPIAGIGFVFSDEDPYCGIDLDDCIDVTTGAIAPWARTLLDLLNSYTEISPSGTGVKVWTRAVKPGDRCKKKYKTGEVEIYDHDRFFAMTGRRLEEYPATVEERQNEVERIYRHVFEGRALDAIPSINGHAAHQNHAHERNGSTPKTTPQTSSDPPADDQAIIERGHRVSPNKFTPLWGGDIAGHDNDDSRADLALCNLLAWLTHRDASRMDRLFRQSGLMRDKWERQDYRDRTIALAIADCADVFDWAPRRRNGTPWKRVQASESGEGGGDGGSAGDSGTEVEVEGCGPHHTDLGLAIRVADAHGLDLRHCHTWRRWFVFDGCRWRPDDTGEVVWRVKKTVADLFRDSLREADRIQREIRTTQGNQGKKQLKEELKIVHGLQKWLVSCEDAKNTNAAIDLLRSEPGIPVRPADLDRDPWLLNCPNGTIDLKTGKLRPHDRRDLLTKHCPVEYHPTAACPTWKKFLNGVFQGDVELIDFFQRALGYSLTGATTEHILVICWGAGSNGKSTLLMVVVDVLGRDYAMVAPATLLMVPKGERHPTEQADLFGKRLVVASEGDEGSRLNEALVKQLTGGDRIRARFMKADFFEFDATHKLFLQTNHRPVIRGQDEGTWRRVRLAPFLARFWKGDEANAPADIPPEQQADPQLAEKLRAEAPGILAWLVEGCLLWHREGLTMPDKVKAATQEYRASEDLVANWIEEHCITGDTSFRARASALNRSFRAWCEETGERPPSQRSFGLALTERGFERQKSNGVWYLGIALREQEAFSIEV
jgi:putative DNA primase/helicase